jgi:hypothetical protein
MNYSMKVCVLTSRGDCRLKKYFVFSLLPAHIRVIKYIVRLADYNGLGRLGNGGKLEKAAKYGSSIPRWNAV